MPVVAKDSMNVAERDTVKAGHDLFRRLSLLVDRQKTFQSEPGSGDPDCAVGIYVEGHRVGADSDVHIFGARLVWGCALLVIWRIYLPPRHYTVRRQIGCRYGNPTATSSIVGTFARLAIDRSSIVQ